MLSLNNKKYLKSLSIKKYRKEEKKVVLEGFRLIDEAIKNGIPFKQIWIDEFNKTKNNIKLLVDTLDNKNIPYTFEKSKDVHSISLTKNSQGLLGLISIDKLFNDSLENFGNNIVILDEISDPGNLGTILRTCAWFGVDSIILTENSADIFNPKCLRAAMGGHFYMKNISYNNNKNIKEFLKQNKYDVLNATLDGKRINDIKINEKWALILGSEAHGINDELNIGEKVSIKQHGQIESLNVSIACGILLNDIVNI